MNEDSMFLKAHHKDTCTHLNPDSTEAYELREYHDKYKTIYVYHCNICNKDFDCVPELTTNIRSEMEDEKYTIEEKDEYTIKELARILILSDSAIKRLIKTNELKSYMKKGYSCRKCNYITKKDLEEFLNKPSNSGLKEIYLSYFRIKKIEDEIERLQRKVKLLRIDRKSILFN